MKDELLGAQKRIKKIPKSLKEALSSGLVKAFFEKILGKENKISSFLSALTISLAEKFSFLNKVKIPWKDFYDTLNAATEKVTKLPLNLQEFIVAHRALGYGRHHSNSKEAIISAIRGGEKQIEIDLRRGIDNKIYLSHDPINEIKHPHKYFIELSDAVKILAEDENQDIVIIFDIKEEGTVEELDTTLEKIDKQFSQRKDYVPMAKRHFVAAFNFRILKNARELRKDRPLIFLYIPLSILKGLGKLIEILGQSRIIEICKIIDKFSGEHLAYDTQKTCIMVNNKEIKGTNKNGDTSLGIFTTLPPNEILKTVEYVCIPAILASIKLIKKLHKKKVKVAVWGVTGSNIQTSIIELGADLVISDTPDIKT